MKARQVIKEILNKVFKWHRFPVSLKAEASEHFEMLSFYKSTRNFIRHNFQLPIPPEVPLCKVEPVWVNLESISFNIKEFFKKLEHYSFDGNS